MADWIGELAKLPLASQPGTRFRYSVATDVLGYLVQVISGMPFESFLKQRIFEPLGMVDTDFWVAPQKVERFAANYGPDAEAGPEGHRSAGDQPLHSTVKSAIRRRWTRFDDGRLSALRPNVAKQR